LPKIFIYLIIISEEVITSEEFRKIIQKTMSKTYKRQEQSRIKKTIKKKRRDLMILNN